MTDRELLELANESSEEMKEEWRKIEIWGNRNYSVSNFGRVKNDKYGKIKSPALLKNGYLVVCLYQGNKQKMSTVHRLVALAFLPKNEDMPQVNHKNGIRHDNRLENLEWCNSSYNNKDAYLRGRVHPMKGKTGSLNPCSKRILATNIATGEMEYFASETEASRSGRGFTRGGIYLARIGRYESYKGYRWQYA